MKENEDFVEGTSIFSALSVQYKYFTKVWNEVTIIFLILYHFFFLVISNFALPLEFMQ